ncbi:L-rhamnose isomerase, partial [Vibrio parahaemolyticus]|nr:L-rhamnose isomerase [Vibrio parahaemolyticus]
DQIKPEHFSRWVEWAKKQDLGLDFNPTLFSHPKADDGLTLSHPDEEIRQFWIEHVKASRKISEYFGRELGTASFMNIWIPDGMKDQPVDRLSPRARLADSLDKALAEKISPEFHKDAVESKLFGIGAEAFTVGSNEFYLAYAATRGTALCLDAGHFHPTEVISDKISACSLYVNDLQLHVTRPVRWDSDHVVSFDDETQAIMREIVRNNLLGRVAIGLDFFDASINRVAAWVIGTRNAQKALLKALLEPVEQLKAAEASFDYTTRLGLIEETHSLPWAAVWNYHCLQNEVPVGFDWINDVKDYEATILETR